MKRNPVQRFSFVPSVFLAIILLFPSFLDVSAQDGNDIWSTPVNLSHSGGTTNPVILVDANQFIHLVWEDRYSGYMHVRGDGEQWSAPRPADLPLDDLSKPPVLLADSQNVIHAFWIDDHNTLFYSSIESRDIGISGKWENPVILGKHVINFSAHVDQDAVVHIAYLVARDTTETPAGIYYVQVTTRGKRPESFPIHQSPYFRRLSDDSEQDQITDLLPISLDIDTGAVNGSTTVFVAWNNPILKRISHRESMDGGETWQDTQDVARPEAVIVDASPQNVHVHADQANIFLTWQYSQSGNCSQFYQFSSDSGVTWDTQREMATRCLEISQFLKSPASGSLLYTNFQNSVFRITWNSPEANPEQVLASFSSFIDPDSYNNIDLQTRQAIILGDKLFMVGSDRGIGGDTWITSAQINIENEGNPRSVSWTKPTTIFTSSLPIYSPQLLVDSSDVLHAFWNQADERYPQGPGMTIFHTNWKDGDHSTPSPILRSPIGKANEQSVSQNSAGQIAIVWSGGESGPIYFSSAPSSGAGISSDWFEPSLLPSPRSVAASPMVVAANDGAVYVVYSIPLNEDRGVYLTKSLDNGKNWSLASRIFNGEIDGCEIVDQVTLTAVSGTLHVTWRCNSIPGGIGPLSLWYSKSDDGGQRWNTAEIVAERPVEWSTIAGAGGGIVHLLWKETSNGRINLWHRISSDNGTTWKSPVNFTSFSPLVGPTALAATRDDHIYLVQILQNDKYIALQLWEWDGKSWSPEEKYNLARGVIRELNSLYATIIPDGQLGVLITGRDLDEKANPGSHSMVYIDHPIDIDPITDVPQPTRIPTAIPIPTLILTERPSPVGTTPTIQPTTKPAATATLTVTVGKEMNSGSSNTWKGLSVAVIATTFVIVGVFVINRRIRHENHKG